MSDALLDRCKALLAPRGGRKTAEEWPVPIERADLLELIARAELLEQAAKGALERLPPAMSLLSAARIDRALRPLD